MTACPEPVEGPEDVAAVEGAYTGDLRGMLG